MNTAKDISGLHSITKPVKRSKRAPKKATRSQNKHATIAALGGALLGFFVPLAAHTLVNAPEFSSARHLLWMVACCLAYSAPTVCAWAGEFTTAGAKHWAAKALGWFKALGFVACLEGILVAAPASCAWLSWVALAMLMGINAVILSVKFRKRQEEKARAAVR